MAPVSEAGRSVQAAAKVLTNRERIMALWEERIRRAVPAAEREPSFILIDTLPVILEQLAQALDPNDPRQSGTDGSTVATEHGGERVRLTAFRIEDLIAEYKLLREVLFEVLDEDGQLAAHDRSTLNTSLDQAVIEACTSYSLVQSKFREQLLAIIAHDLRNPLGVAHVNADLILHDPTGAQVPRWAARIVQSIGRVDRMVQDLLDTVRVQTGARLQLALDQCDLVDVVRSTIEPLIARYGDRFVLNASGPVRGYFAPEALRRAVENLLTNAVTYGAQLPITVTIEQTHGRAILRVHNHGPPIPVEKRETLFRAFQRAVATETSGKRGWGLGLAQARAVAEAHGGSIAVDSVPDRGTTFTIDIPMDARPFQNKPTTESLGAVT